MNATHDPQRQSWVASANHPGGAFPIQNLPFGVFRAAPTIGVAIGDQILDLRGCCHAGLLAPLSAATREACAATTLNPLMAGGPESWSPLRALLSDLLRAAIRSSAVGGAPSVRHGGSHHAQAGMDWQLHRLLRLDRSRHECRQALPAGESSAAQLQICAHRLSRSGIFDCHERHARETPGRPDFAAAGAPPHFAPTQALDYEIEAGFFIGQGNQQGEAIPIDRAPAHLFGVCLLNDWTARDIQAWEYQPLGPFLAKSFATTISPWVVTMEALAPFRTACVCAPAGGPRPLPYLDSEQDRQQGGIDLTLEVYLRSARMRATGCDAVRLSRGSLGDMYWTIAQLLTHHASNGCNLQPGDLLGSGTVSGPKDESRGCLLELTRRGVEAITLPTGEQRGFLADGDEIIFRGYCERTGFVSIGLGECSGTITESSFRKPVTNMGAHSSRTLA